MIVVSDHDMEPVEPGAVDLHAEALDRGLSVHVEHDGTACWAVGDTTEEELLGLPSVDGVQWVADRHWILWGQPGQQYGIDFGLAGQHGSPRTARQLAVVGGGHAVAGPLGDWLRRETPTGTDWAPIIRHNLGLLVGGA